MRATTVCLTTAAVSSAYFLACVLLWPSGNNGIKTIAGLFLVALGLFAITERKIQKKHVASSAIIAVAVGTLVPLIYLLIFISSQGYGYTFFTAPLLFFAPIALPTACLAFILLGGQPKKKSEKFEENPT